MDRRLLAPRWLALHVGVTVAVAACALLGYWQLDRAFDLHAASLQNAANVEAAPIALDAVLSPEATLETADIGRRVLATGRYDSARGLLVPDRQLDGADGYLVLTPLRTDDGTAIVVVRGWLADPLDGSAPLVPAPPLGPVTVEGWLDSSEQPPPLSASPPSGQIASVHLPSLVNLVPYELYDAVLTRAAQGPTAATELRPLPPPVPATGGSWSLQNLFYAVEWWVFGLAAVALWVSAVRRLSAVRRRHQPTEPGRTRADPDQAARAA